MCHVLSLRPDPDASVHPCTVNRVFVRQHFPETLPRLRCRRGIRSLYSGSASFQTPRMEHAAGPSRASGGGQVANAGRFALRIPQSHCRPWVWRQHRLALPPGDDAQKGRDLYIPLDDAIDVPDASCRSIASGPWCARPVPCIIGCVSFCRAKPSDRLHLASPLQGHLTGRQFSGHSGAVRETARCAAQSRRPGRR